MRKKIGGEIESGKGKKGGMRIGIVVELRNGWVVIVGGSEIGRKIVGGLIMVLDRGWKKGEVLVGIWLRKLGKMRIGMKGSGVGRKKGRMVVDGIGKIILRRGRLLIWVFEGYLFWCWLMLMENCLFVEEKGRRKGRIRGRKGI